MATLLHQYQNGNTSVSIYDDGTKVRTLPDNEPIRIVFPESMDIKLTNYCDAGCSYCHEKSTIFGQHGDLKALLEVLKDIPAGTELACLSGNTVVFTNDGAVDIKDLKIGDCIFDSNHDLKKIINIKKSNKKPLKLIGTKSFNIISSKDHPFLVDSKEVFAKDLVNKKIDLLKEKLNQTHVSIKPIDLTKYITEPSPVGRGGSRGGKFTNNRVRLTHRSVWCNRHIPITQDLMWLYGLVVAEGSKKSISLHKEEKEMANYAKYIYKMIVNLNSNTFYKENGQAVEFEQPFIYQKIFFDAMRIGYGAHNKTLSFLFSIEDKELIRSALFGLFQGDGAFRKRNMGLKSKSFNLTFKTVSKKLVYELAYLLRKHFGICAAVYHGVSPDRYLEGRLLKSSDYYKLDIYASEDIENLFPAIFEKDEDYKKLISNKSKKNSLKEIKIKSIEETDPEVLYDITLEESSSHIFPVNGYVLTHNCGGGNALEHPEFISFLREAKNRGWICNVTVNQKHLDSLVLPEVIKAGLVYGVGISVVSKGFADNIKRIRDLSPNVVFHVINGINKPEDVDWLCEGYDLTKVLLLGYKEFGRGLEYLARKNKVSEIKQQWLWKIRSYLGRKDLIMSFDNLAIEQTQVKRFLKQATWDKHFMGEEGQFSMYVDAIKQQYALTSTSEARTSFQDKSLLEFFKYKR